MNGVRRYFRSGAAKQTSRLLPVLLLAAAATILPGASSLAAPRLPELTDPPVSDRLNDWRYGYLYVFGVGVPPEGPDTAARRWQRGLAAAWDDAQAKLAAAAVGLPFGGQRSLGEFTEGEGGRRAQRALRRYLPGAEPMISFRHADGTVTMWIRAPFYGPRGLATVPNRKIVDRDDKGPRQDDQPGTGPYLVVALATVPPVSQPVLWPRLLAREQAASGEPEVVFADLPLLCREGLLPAGFRVFRVRAGEVGNDPLLPAVDLGRALRVTQHPNAIDYVLERPPEPGAVFTPYAYQGLIIVEP